MKIIRPGEVRAADADPRYFHGSVARRVLDRATAPNASVALVTFQPGGTTAWHRHPDGQYLYVLDGEGRVESRSGDVEVVRAGDLVYASPGEEHRHGATEARAVTHLGFSLGATEWLDEE